MLDIVHVLEYLWSAAYAFHAEGRTDAEQWVEAPLLALLNGRSGGEVAKSLRLMIKTHASSTLRLLEPVDEVPAQYLVNNTRLLHYDRRARGRPADRHGRDRGGVSLSRQGSDGPHRRALVARRRRGRAATCVRCATSGDFDDYWAFHLAKEHERNHKSRYADGEVPNPLPPSRPKLRLVK